MTDPAPRKRMGRPSSYREEYVALAAKFCLLGATNEGLARSFEVDEATIKRWMRRYPDFCAAVKKGREEADANVSASLYRRANGYTQDAVKIFYDTKAQKTVKVSYIERFAPDTIACIFWLKNRRPDLWRDKQNLEHTGKNDGPIEIVDPGAVRDKLADRMAGIAARMAPGGATGGTEPGGA